MPDNLVSAMASDLLISEQELGRIFARAPYAYKVYKIPKKNGGMRTIAQPARETKYVQYWLINNEFFNLPIHDCATAYKTGSSIKDNAERHKRNSYIVKFDFKDFFTSIKKSELGSF